MNDKLFKYKAVSDMGNIIVGSVFAESKELAIKKIEFKGHVILKINQAYSLFFRKNISLSESLKLIEEIFAYVSYGLTFFEALKYVSDDERLSVSIRYASASSAVLLSEGKDVSVALSKSGISKGLSSAVSAAIYSGRLEKMMPDIIKQYKSIQKIRRQWLSLSIYPIIMLIFLSITMAVMIEYLSPLQKKVMLNIAGNNLDNIPERSRKVFQIVDNFTNYLIYYFPLFVFSILLFHYLLKAKVHRYNIISRMVWYKMPYSGFLVYKLEVASLLKSIHISLNSGLSEVESINLLYGQTEDKYLLTKLSTLKESVENGQMTIGEAFEKAQLLKGIHVAILRSEKGGRESLIKCLYNIGTSIETSVMDKLKTFSSISGVIGDLMIYIFATPVILSIVIPQFDGILMIVSKF